MAHHSHSSEAPVVKCFTGTSIFSFSIIFLLLVLMANCHGPYKVPVSHHATTTEAAHSQPAEHH